MTENWYIILELEFYPNPVNDVKVIEAKIEEKRKFWSTKANHPQKGGEYKKYLQLVPEIKKDMLSDDNIRAELIKDACEKTFGVVDKTLKMIKTPEIPLDTIEKIAASKKISVDIVKLRAVALGKKIIETKSVDYESIYNKYYKTKPQNADVFKQMDNDLIVFNAKNLYKFLFPKQTLNNAQNISCDKIVETAKNKKSQEYTKHDAISSAGSKLCVNCEKIFVNEASKQIYDKYLEYLRIKGILDELKEFYNTTGAFDKENYADWIDRLTEVLKNRTEAGSLLVAFCKIEKILIPAMDDSQSKKNVNLKVCRCGCTTDVSDGRTTCKACGLPLQIKCPQCETLNDAIIKVCKCGFHFANIDKAVSLCELASIALESMDFDAARANIADAEKYWPKSEKVSEVRSRLKELEERVGQAASKMRLACQQENFYEAKECLDKIKKTAPSFHDAVLEEQISTAVEAAERYKKIALSSKNETDIVDACAKAYEASKDCPGIKAIISKYPPSTPTNLTVTANTDTDVNVLRWTKSSTPGLLYYSVVRKEGAVPNSILDGTLIGRVSMCSLTDNSIKSGVQYYYAVFAERAGICSAPLALKSPIANFFEISGVKLAAGDGIVQITWSPIPENAVVGIEKTWPDGKTKDEICNSRQNYVDRGLTNDKQYKYKVYLVYTIGSSKTKTPGVNVSGIPTQPPLPIERLFIKPDQGDDFQIEWENPNNGEVSFFCSEKKPEWLPGDLVSESEIESKMSGLVVTKTGANKGRFKHADDKMIYVLAVVMKSGSAVIGTIARASKGGAVKIKSCSIVNDKIMITLDLPKYCTGFIVMYRPDQYPNDMNDAKATRKYVPLKQFQFDGGIVIDSNDKIDYYFSIFAEFRADGECDYSPGTDFNFHNEEKKTIVYSVKTNKRLFGDSQVVISFEGPVNTLPAIDIISGIDFAPLFRGSGDIFYSIGEQEMAGGVKVTIPIPKKTAKDTYIRPFFHDASNESKYKLSLKVGSQLQIT